MPYFGSSEHAVVMHEFLRLAVVPNKYRCAYALMTLVDEGLLRGMRSKDLIRKPKELLKVLNNGRSRNKY